MNADSPFIPKSLSQLGGVALAGSATSHVLAQRASDGKFANRPGNAFNVLDFGADDTATGSGTSGQPDSTVAIQAAIDAARLKGATVYLPAGGYSVSELLRVGSGITFKGDGPNSTILYARDATKSIIYSHDGAEFLFTTIADLQFFGTGKGAASDATTRAITSGGCAIHIKDNKYRDGVTAVAATECTFRNLYIRNFPKHAIAIGWMGTNGGILPTDAVAGGIVVEDNTIWRSSFQNIRTHNIRDHHLFFTRCEPEVTIENWYSVDDTAVAGDVAPLGGSYTEDGRNYSLYAHSGNLQLRTFMNSAFGGVYVESGEAGTEVYGGYAELWNGDDFHIVSGGLKIHDYYWGPKTAATTNKHRAIYQAGGSATPIILVRCNVKAGQEASYVNGKPFHSFGGWQDWQQIGTNVREYRSAASGVMHKIGGPCPLSYYQHIGWAAGTFKQGDEIETWDPSVASAGYWRKWVAVADGGASVLRPFAWFPGWNQRFSSGGAITLPVIDRIRNFQVVTPDAALTINAPTFNDVAPVSDQSLVIQFYGGGTACTLTFATGAGGFALNGFVPPAVPTANFHTYEFRWSTDNNRWNKVSGPY